MGRYPVDFEGFWCSSLGPEDGDAVPFVYLFIDKKNS